MLAFKSTLFLLFALTFAGHLPAYAGDSWARTDEMVRSLETDYRINVFTDYVPRATWPITGEPATEADEAALHGFVVLLDQELRKYPPTFIHNTHLGAIVLVKDLALDGQRRAAVPDYIRQVLWLDYKDYVRRDAYQRHIIHHEFYHMIEYELHGDAYWKDPLWMAFNPPNFRYGAGGVTAYADKSKPWYLPSHPRFGFINLYSMLGVEEDKAEVFATLFMPKEAAQVAEWAQNDATLRAKTFYLKGAVAQVDGSMDERYWAKLNRTTP